MEKSEQELQVVARLLEDLFLIDAFYRQGVNRVAFSLRFRYDAARSLKLIEDRLKTAGYQFDLSRNDAAGLLLTIDPHPRWRIPIVNLALFVATVFTVYVVPVFLKLLPFAPTFSDAVDLTVAALAEGQGLEFALALISILVVHEMGHFIAGRRRQIVTSWPYFIPAPSFIGTFGAIIKSKSPFWNRRDLIEVGATGPIAGWIVALAWLVYGLSQSRMLPPDAFFPMELAFSMDGESLLMRGLTTLLVGTAPQGHFYYLTEAAFAGWVGLLVTAINLLPIGQLDGGHIVYGLWRKKQHSLGLAATLGLVILGIWSQTWWFFAVFGLIFGMKHPPTLNDTAVLTRTSRILGWVALIILVISFTPVPFR